MKRQRLVSQAPRAVDNAARERCRRGGAPSFADAEDGCGGAEAVGRRQNAFQSGPARCKAFRCSRQVCLRTVLPTVVAGESPLPEHRAVSGCSCSTSVAEVGQGVSCSSNLLAERWVLLVASTARRGTRTRVSRSRRANGCETVRDAVQEPRTDFLRQRCRSPRPTEGISAVRIRLL